MPCPENEYQASISRAQVFTESVPVTLSYNTADSMAGIDNQELWVGHLRGLQQPTDRWPKPAACALLPPSALLPEPCMYLLLPPSTFGPRKAPDLCSIPLLSLPPRAGTLRTGGLQAAGGAPMGCTRLTAVVRRRSHFLHPMSGPATLLPLHSWRHCASQGRGCFSTSSVIAFKDATQL